MTDWAAIQAGAYSNTTKKARELSDMIINSRLSRPELESLSFIIQLEIMKRKAHKESKKIIHLDKFKDQQHQGQAQGPEQAAPPEGQGPGSAAGAFLGDQQQGQGAGSAAPPEGGQES